MGFTLKGKAAVVDPATYSPRYLLHRHLCNESKLRPYGEVHASDLMGQEDFCPREHALGLEYGVHRGATRIYTSEQVTFDYGKAVEDLVRGWFADIGRAYGDWKCLACNQLHRFCRRPVKCKKCGARGFKYEEVAFLSPEGVIMRPDLYIDFGKPKLTMVEIKSIDKEKIKSLYAPLAEHRWRTNLYLRGIANSGGELAERIDTQKAFILYISKGGYGHQDDVVKTWKLKDGDYSPFKEFEVERNDEETDELMEYAAAVDEYKKTGKIPLGICPTSVVRRAKYCKMHDQCWGGDH